MPGRATYWVVQDDIHGLLTRYAQLTDGAILRSMPLDVHALRPVRLRLSALRWIKTDSIPSTAFYIGDSDEPLNVENFGGGR